MLVSNLGSRGSKKGAPTKQELKQICTEVAAESFPEMLITAVEHLFKQHGYELIWGVACRPNYMSIELMWAHAKRFVNEFGILSTKFSYLGCRAV